MITRQLTASLGVLAIVACACLSSAGSAHASSITINGYTQIQARASVFGFPGSTDTENFTGTATIPMYATFGAMTGVAYSNHVLDFSIVDGQTILSFDTDQQRGLAVELIVDSFSFTATANEPFALSGFYNSAADSRRTHNVHLIEDGTGTLFRQIQDGNDGGYTVGVPGGGNFIDSMVGSPTGNLVAGRSYTLHYSVATTGFTGPPTDTAIGNLTLTIGVPEPSSISLAMAGCLLVGVKLGLMRRGSRETRRAACG